MVPWLGIGMVSVLAKLLDPTKGSEQVELRAH